MDSIYLNGLEDVRAAGNRMSSAADAMQRAASEISSAMDRQQRFMDDWLNRLAEVLERKP